MAIGMMPGKGTVNVIARGSCDEAIHFCSDAGREMDCFVATTFARRRASADASRNDVVRFPIQISNGRNASTFSRRKTSKVLLSHAAASTRRAGSL